MCTHTRTAPVGRLPGPRQSSQDPISNTTCHTSARARRPRLRRPPLRRLPPRLWVRTQRQRLMLKQRLVRLAIRRLLLLAAIPLLLLAAIPRPPLPARPPRRPSGMSRSQPIPALRPQSSEGPPVTEGEGPGDPTTTVEVGAGGVTTTPGGEGEGEGGRDEARWIQPKRPAPPETRSLAPPTRPFPVPAPGRCRSAALPDCRWRPEPSCCCWSGDGLERTDRATRSPGAPDRDRGPSARSTRIGPCRSRLARAQPNH